MLTLYSPEYLGEGREKSSRLIFTLCAEKENHAEYGEWAQAYR
jgi:hypothetical protein